MAQARRKEGVPEEALVALVAAVSQGQRLRCAGTPARPGTAEAEDAELLRCEAEEAAAAAGNVAAPDAEAALPGRSTGTLEWRAARGELGSGGAGGGGVGSGSDSSCAVPAAPPPVASSAAPLPPSPPNAASSNATAIKALVHAHFALLTEGCSAEPGKCRSENCGKGAGGSLQPNAAAIKALALAKAGLVPGSGCRSGGGA